MMACKKTARIQDAEGRRPEGPARGQGQRRLEVHPLVILTSSPEERDLVESYQLGVNAYVVKPVDFGRFVEAIKKLDFFWAVLNEPTPLSGQYPNPAG